MTTHVCHPSKQDAIKSAPLDVAIIGGGIAGLYCGFNLSPGARKGKPLKPCTFQVFEATDHWGGKIWSARYMNSEYDQKSSYNHAQDSRKLEFCAEFGPMRIELDQQELLAKLIEELELKDACEDFPAYASPADKHDPHYELQGEEASQETPMDLLKLGILKILGRICPISRAWIDDGNASSTAHNKNDQENMRALEGRLNDLTRQLAVQQSNWKRPLERWVGTLGEIDYQRIRQYAVFDDGTQHGTALWKMGFWNLLSEVLSHQAILKLRDQGTFYHLIPENPNAAEWLIFWLRGIKTSEKMVGLSGGMQRIAEELCIKIGEKSLSAFHKLKQIQLSPDSNTVLLKFSTWKKIDGKLLDAGCCWYRAKHVVLALPKAPLEELVAFNADRFPRLQAEEQSQKKDFHYFLDAVQGFPLVKVFIVLNRRWWKSEGDAAETQHYATRIPTRELHYRSSRLKESKKGMVLIYTDRPASSFWPNYIKVPGSQEIPEWGGVEKNERLVRRCVDYIHELGREFDQEHPNKSSGLQAYRTHDVDSYGIRDWGREPYKGAAHAWRPERMSWKVMKKLSAFSLVSPLASSDSGNEQASSQTDKSNIHICGEAYSDYHGFMEGALRSAAHVLHLINNTLKLTSEMKTLTWWLCDCNKCKKLVKANRHR